MLLSRYREQRRSVPGGHDALRGALIGAGTPILFSALTVVVSMATLLVFPLRFLRSMGYGGVTAAAIALATALVVLPSILCLLGHRVDALGLPRWRRAERRSRLWTAVGQLVTGRPVLILSAVAAVLVLTATPAARVRWTTVDAGSLPSSAEAHRADAAINDSNRFIRHGGTPLYLVLGSRQQAAAQRLTARIRQLTAVRAVSSPRPLDRTTWLLNVIAVGGPYSSATQTLVGQLRRLLPGDQLAVGGDAAAFRDERQAIGHRLPLAVALLAIGMLIILFALTGAIVAPLLALAMNALTLSAAFGLLVLIFQDGRLQSVLGFSSQGALDLTIPLVLVTIVFAIATDYGVFLLSRVGETRHAHDQPAEGVAASVALVGPIVAAAAVLFAASIGIFGSSDIIVLKILGVGTALAVLLDAVLVRSLLFPAALALLGATAWWPSSRAHRH